MARKPSDKLSRAFAGRQQVWTGQLWNPEWASQFEGVGCGELMSLDHPEEVLNAFSALLGAGADGISTNTFGATTAVMIANSVPSQGIAELAFEANLQSARLARMAADEYSSETHPRWVLGALGPTLHCLTIMGGGESKFQQIKYDYYRQACALLEGGVDLLYLEGCMDVQNMQAALLAIEQVQTEIGRRIPIMLTGRIEATERMLDGSTAAQFATMANRFQPVAIGLTGRDLNQLLALLNTTRSPAAVFPDVFAVASEEGWFKTPSSLAEQLESLSQHERVRILGIGLGCRPEYVTSVVASRDKLEGNRAPTNL